MHTVVKLTKNNLKVLINVCMCTLFEVDIRSTHSLPSIEANFKMVTDRQMCMINT